MSCPGEAMGNQMRDLKGAEAEAKLRRSLTTQVEHWTGERMPNARRIHSSQPPVSLAVTMRDVYIDLGKPGVIRAFDS